MAIIVTTYNRCAHLRQTLTAFATLHIPTNWRVSLYVVDNASTDETAFVVAQAQLSQISVHYVYEARHGKTHAQNTALREATQADIFLWTDDDVHPPPNWIEAMCTLIAEGKADGVYGQIRMAPHLEREWMTPAHYERLADTRFLSDNWGAMIGANMAFHRRVVERVPAFDTNLGPGQLGFADDILYSLQTLEAGFTLVGSDATVEHHFDVSRLLRQAWLKNAEGNGRSDAYLLHHWHHQSVSMPRAKLAFWILALRLHRLTSATRSPHAEGCDLREIRLVEKCAFLRQLLVESARPREYDSHGLVQLRK